MGETDDFERTLKLDLMRMDLTLKTKQAFWETPRNLAIVVGTVAAVSTAVAGTLGFKLGQQDRPQQPVVINLVQPAPSPAQGR